MNPKWTIADAEFVAGVTAPDQIPPPALSEVAFAGRSNVGKSSLLNALLGRKNLVRTGGTPGTTRQLNLFRARAVDGLEVVFVDLPGYGYAKRAKSEKTKWGALIETYLQTRVTLRAVVLIVDVRRGAESEERDLIDFVRATEGRVSRPVPELIVVATKLDKLSQAQQKPAVLRAAQGLGCKILGFSAETGHGREELWAALRGRLSPALEPAT
jgi:GTP-binding protein